MQREQAAVVLAQKTVGCAAQAQSAKSLVIFPGEKRTGSGTTVGHIYAVGERGVKAYDAVGGPPPGQGFRDVGGHLADVTPAGRYVLDRAEHHITDSWPRSVVPWGAEIRDNDGIVEYRAGGIWKPASGRFGEVTHAIIQFVARSNQHVDLMNADILSRDMFFSRGVLISPWNRNDFGKWSWNLKKDGQRTAFYIHTVPVDDVSSDPGAFTIEQSHGCIHIRPRDRDDMVQRGFLKEGVAVEVMPYGLVGPPR
jgi:hypothetical protein